MRKILPLLVLITMNLVCLAQTQQQKTDPVCALVKKYFNEKDASKLYDLTGEGFHQQLPWETFQNVCNTNLFPLGEIKETIFEGNISGVSKYKAVFATVNLDLLLKLDNIGKIATFIFKPYTDVNAKKNVSVPFNNPLTNALDKVVDSIMQVFMAQLHTVGASIAILKDGKTYYYGYGETAKGNNSIPDNRTIFEIGSISKTFTATLLADAVSKGKIKLDDPVNKYLPDSIPAITFEGVPVTIRSLINHSSGIPRMPDNMGTNKTDPYIDYDDSKMFSFYKNFTPTRKPGDKYEYSNLAVGTVGVILERINKDSYENMLLKTICKPLDMHDTKVYLQNQDSVRFAKGYSDGNFAAPWNFKAFMGAGGIRSTVADMIRYAQAQLGTAPAALNSDIQLTHTVTFKTTDATLGMAWLYRKPGKDQILFHNGATGGYKSYLAVNLQKKFAVVILSNTTISVDGVGNGLMKWLEQGF
ncbi:MAG: serine hydrolase domain-containing protein [Bacteroidota bacterium]